ncbi:MAG: hypothetical protein ACREFT_14045 [Acetobacteraceae bacterium]
MKLRMGTVAGALAVALLSWASVASSLTPQSEMDNERNFTYQPAAGLVAAVREATARYQDVAEAVHDGYTPVLGCVSSPDEGAMGVHYLNPDLIGDGVEDVAHPELLVYEPLHNGRLHLVAVEYLTLAELWDANHTDGSPPILMGQLFDYTSGPNRFRLPAHYSLHVWAWKYNPAGVFSMWNPAVSCKEYTEA